MIAWLRDKQHGGQPIREDGPQSHLLTKKGTPTMGGLMMLLSVGVSTLLWADLSNQYIWITLFITFGFGLLGFADDYLKVTKKNTKGVSGKTKLAVQFAFCFSAALWIQTLSPDAVSTHLAFPFFKNFMLDLGILYIPFIMIVIINHYK